jgi:phosphatidylglycerophosphatase A
MKRKIAWVLATWFGCGLVPLAPGTVGSLGAIPLYLAVRPGGRAAVAATAIIVTVVGIWAGSVVSGELKKKDPQVIVVDEVAGLLVTMLPVREASFRTVAVGFLVFRMLDVVKPWPVRRIEQLPLGWGIVLDDVAAGVLGACIMLGLHALGALP